MMAEDYEEVGEFEAWMARALADAEQEVQRQATEQAEIQQEEQKVVEDLKAAADEDELYWRRFVEQLG